MSLRLRNRWKQGDRTRTLEDIASVCAVNAWRVACNGVLNLENEGFETTTQAQRLDIIEEFLALLLHVTDHAIYAKFSEEERARFITAVAMRMAILIEDNRTDAQGSGEYRKPFVDKLNDRTGAYAECRYDVIEGPGFGLLRTFGEWVSAALGPTNRKWALDQVVAITGPEAVESFTRSLDGLLAGSDDAAGRGSRGPTRPMAED